MTAPSFVAIDPGYAKRGKGCAVAYFAAGHLAAAYFARASVWVSSRCPSTGVDFVLVEQPQYEGGTNGRSTRCNPAVLMQLGWEGALLAGLYAGAAGCSAIAKTPRQWKGSIQKPMHHAALWAVLTLGEHRVLGGDATGAAIDRACERGALDRWSKPGVEYYPAGFLMHNLLDAVALGCQHIGRLNI